MKIELNLLPKSREKKNRNKKVLRFIIVQEIMIVLITLMFWGVIRSIDAVAGFRLEEEENQIDVGGNSDKYAEMKKYENKLREVKDKMDFVNNLQQNEINWLVVLEKIPGIISENITLTSIKNDGFEFDIKGKASNRDTLIEMKNAVEKENCFSDVEIPLNDMVLKNDIDFELKFNAKEECLKNYEEE